MQPEEFIQLMPKIELHVHLEGSVRPETLLVLAKKHGQTLPANSPEELKSWYKFTDFAHFVEIYVAISNCIRTPEDIELITREFLSGQAEQNILYSEVTYTPYTHFVQKGLSVETQLAAINKARAWAKETLGVEMGLVLDISRHTTAAEGLIVAEWAIKGRKDGVIALGLGGPEIGNPPEKFAEAFDLAYKAGLPAVPHAGETVGPASIWGALETLKAVRLGHGVRCLEDKVLVEELRRRQIPLEVCLNSNVCLRVVRTLKEHPLPELLAEGLFITLGSDDPPMFNTTLTDEYLALVNVFKLDIETIKNFVLNGVVASLASKELKAQLTSRIENEFKVLQLNLTESLS